MTMEELKQKLKERGLNTTERNSKKVELICSILADEPLIYDVKDLEYKASCLESRIKLNEELLRQLEEKYKCTNYQSGIEDIEEVYFQKKSELEELDYKLRQKKYELEKEEYRTILDYINAFNKSVQECETPEGRDTLRELQVFVNNVSINTKYDNTAYIIGLSSIISNGKIDAVQELKKINPDLVVEPKFKSRSDDDDDYLYQMGWHNGKVTVFKPTEYKKLSKEEKTKTAEELGF